MNLILASSSKPRQALLNRLGLPFQVIAPDVDERAFHHDCPVALARLLAEKKAQAVAQRFPTAVVLGSDQTALHEGVLLCKPFTRENARNQLRALRGASVSFTSAAALLGPRADDLQVVDETTIVRFRTYSEAEIEHYLDQDSPLHCLGAMKSESLGISLIESAQSADPTALIGMPLIKVSAMLRHVGINPLLPS